jgi:protein SCO1
VNRKRVLLLFLMLGSLSGRLWAAHSYSARGLVLKVDKAHLSALISCEKIPGLMDAMVMAFAVRNSDEFAGVNPGALIDFTLVVDHETSYINEIHVRKYESVEPDPLTARRLKLVTTIGDPESMSPEIKIGGQVPDFSLIDQGGHPVTLSEFRGKVVGMTFTYTHCALPNFCFRIANNFRLVQKRFANDMGRDLILMTVTFDPLHDTPDVMARYGKVWGADATSWLLLTGPPSEVGKLSGLFGVGYWADEGLMIHSLHTVLIDREGNLAANLEGNEFSANELGDLIQTMLGRRRPIVGAQPK